MKQQTSIACNYSEASDWCDTGAKIKKEGESFVISLKGFPIPPQH